MANIVPVVFCFDKRIILGASVAIKSLIDCAKPDTTYDIRVFHSDLNKKTQQALQQLVNDTRHKLQFHTIDETKFKNAPHNNGSWRANVYYRLLTPEILTEYDKAIYSDVDVLFKGDLSEVYNTDIENYECAAVPTYYNLYLKEINSKRYFPENKNEKNYISSFILFNNKLMREEKTVDKFFETIKIFNKRLVYFDMDCFNLTCTRIKDLPLNYTTFETLYEFTDIKNSPEYKALSTLYTIDELQKVRENPVVIHYAGSLGKPWQRKWVPDYYQEYINKLPKNLVKYTLRDIRKKWTSKKLYPKQHYDVGIVNFYYSQNYCACLTAYALQEIIKDLGYSCAFLNEFKKRKKYRLSFGTLFVNKYLKQMPRFNNLTQAGKMADMFIAGSDQIFRPMYLKKRFGNARFLLKFVHNDAKKIAFSASFGIGLEEFQQAPKKIKEDIKKSLKDFDYISTRELSGVDICKQELCLHAEQILDPVFLMNRSKFENLAEKSQQDFKNKIVAYILDKNPIYQELYNNLQKHYGLDVCDIKTQKLSVEDWLKAYIDAEYIITDSFHGACFAILFNKPFIAIVNKKRGSSRFETLSKIFGLEEQFINSINETNDIKFKSYDYTKINALIEQERKRGKEILKRELKRVG